MSKVLKIGIQGGKGSFNEEALSFLRKNNTQEYELVYLHTTAAVLKALNNNEINQGQFAIHNSTGGMVHESIHAMAKYSFKIVKEFGISIRHALMIRSDSSIEKIDTIMTHPQVLKQCKDTLKAKYPNLNKTSGEGVLIDHAQVAKALNNKELDKNIAVMGSRVLADIYGLTIIEENMQDLKDNYTGFLLIEKL